MQHPRTVSTAYHAEAEGYSVKAEGMQQLHRVSAIHHAEAGSIQHLHRDLPLITPRLAVYSIYAPYPAPI